jgi:hypothetical protein
VRGQEGRLCLAEAGRCTLGDGLTEVSWTEPSGTSISVHSRTFDGAQVLAIAEGLRIDGRDVELGDFPAGGERPPLAAELDRRDSSVYQVNYRVGAGGDLFISTDTENEAERIYDIWFFGPRDDGVQGHPARFEDAGGGTFWVAWSPGPGLVVDILMSGVDEATAREIVESVRPATDAEWADLLDQIAAYHSGYGGSDPERDQDPAPGSPDPTIGLDPLPDNALLRETAGGGRVWGWQASNGDLCYRMVNNGASEVCAAEADVLGVSPSADAIAAVVGFAPEGTASIEGGETTFGEQVEGGRLFVWESADGDVPDTLTFLDDDGDEIATREVTVL